MRLPLFKYTGESREQKSINFGYDRILFGCGC